MPSKVVDMIGKTFGEWKVITFSHYDINNKRYYNCVCLCGNERAYLGSELRRGGKTKCQKCNGHGHGMIKTLTYYVWGSIKQRCLNPKNKNYRTYGGRGVTICDKWLLFKGFFKDMGEKPEGLQIDRIDNNKGYYKENCRWVTPKVNANNRRTTKIAEEENK